MQHQDLVIRTTFAAPVGVPFVRLNGHGRQGTSFFPMNLLSIMKTTHKLITDKSIYNTACLEYTIGHKYKLTNVETATLGAKL